MFGLFGKKNKQKEMEEKIEQIETKNHMQKECDYSGLTEITKIITNGNAQSMEDISLLVEDSMAFMQKYELWCNNMLKGIADRQGVMLVAAAYWLTGYSVEGFAPPFYGAFIDWKEATEGILWNFKKPIQNLGYPISLDEISFTGQEYTDEALQTIHDYFTTKGFVLVALDN